MEKKTNYYWIEQENVAGCDCCAWYTYEVMGWDAEGDWVQYGPYPIREDAEIKIAVLEGGTP